MSPSSDRPHRKAHGERSASNEENPTFDEGATVVSPAPVRYAPPRAPVSPPPTRQTPAPSIEAAPGPLSAYLFGACLGRGGFGEVYEAHDQKLDRPVAVKLLTEHKRSPRALARFQDEGRLLARLLHPKIVQVYQAGVSEEGRPFLVMERFGAGSLATHLLPGVPLPWRLAARIIKQLLEALEAAHDAGIFHRDVKESNLLFDPASESVKLCDFGIARAQTPMEEEVSTTAEGRWVGTRAYLSPERLMGRSARDDPSADLYAAGVVFYRLLSGSRPFFQLGEVPSLEEQLYRSLHIAPPAPAACPAALAQLALSLIAPSAEQRPESALVALARLNVAISQSEESEKAARQGAPRFLEWREGFASNFSPRQLFIFVALIILVTGAFFLGKNSKEGQFRGPRLPQLPAAQRPLVERSSTATQVTPSSARPSPTLSSELPSTGSASQVPNQRDRSGLEPSEPSATPRAQPLVPRRSPSRGSRERRRRRRPREEVFILPEPSP
ncbi:MAG: serine/threonine-protein kinase [Myxococcota bacterium]|nr:serine/threonine-protein kinase [Myxococcota bacterium]